MSDAYRKQRHQSVYVKGNRNNRDKNKEWIGNHCPQHSRQLVQAATWEKVGFNVVKMPARGANSLHNGSCLKYH